MRYNDAGEEIPDDRPVEVPLKFKRPLSIQEEIQRYIRIEASMAAGRDGLETFDEANDFEVEDDDEFPLSSAERAALLAEEYRIAKQDKEVLDGNRELMQNFSRRPKPTSKKESADVHESRVGSDGEGAGDAGEVSAASRGKGRAAG